MSFLILILSNFLSEFFLVEEFFFVIQALFITKLSKNLQLKFAFNLLFTTKKVFVKEPVAIIAIIE